VTTKLYTVLFEIVISVHSLLFLFVCQFFLGTRPDISCNLVILSQRLFFRTAQALEITIRLGCFISPREKYYHNDDAVKKLYKTIDKRSKKEYYEILQNLGNKAPKSYSDFQGLSRSELFNSVIIVVVLLSSVITM